jgi:hypothetical protein
MSIIDRQMEHLGISDLSQVGRRFARPEMTTPQLKSFLLREFKMLKGRIIYDDAIILQSDDQMVELMNRPEREEMKKAAEEGSSEKRRTQVDKAFWDLQKRASKVAAQTPDYADACHQLGVNPEKPVLNTLGNEDAHHTQDTYQNILQGTPDNIASI